MKDLRIHQDNSLSSLGRAIRGIINLPTGTGKTLIQSRAIVKDILNHQGQTKVYVILSPRILLSNQLMNDVRRDLVENGVEAQYCIVHSGRVKEDLEDLELERDLGLTYRETPCGTTKSVVQEAYRRAVAEKVSLVISGTYHSAERIKQAGIPVNICFCDEAHYLVQGRFSWIVSEPFPSAHAYYFTATLRETPSKEGMGMNNNQLFGDILYQEKPIVLIAAGEMIHPRMHVVDMSHDPDGDEADGLAVAAAFEEHRSAVNVGAKLLVVAKDGSNHLDNLASHPEIQQLLEIRPTLHIFDISSAHGARIDGKVVKREKFLKQLRSMTDSDEAIIIHHDILAEGIDVPGITGVMPLISLGKAKFLQTLGRATRLHSKDRVRLYAKELSYDELKRFVKPYAWLIIPIYGEIGEDLYAEMKEYVRELRDYGFDPAEDILVRQKRGKRQLAPIATVNEPTRVMTGFMDFTANVIHEIEREEEAELNVQEMNRFKSLSLGEKIDNLALDF